MASAMIETFRSIGYNIETAIADIVDNSISAGAKHVWISYDWKGAETTLWIKDDGMGMTNEGLIQALRPGSKDPRDQRDPKDLGRFGLGLKTASFSQCKCVTAVSKQMDGPVVHWAWDLDYVREQNEWVLIQRPLPNWVIHEMDGLTSGTMIMWDHLDRLVFDLKTDDKDAHKKFLEVMDTVRKHCAMVFHRFIQRKHIQLFFQGSEIEAWDPFLEDHMATQRFSEDKLSYGRASMKGFVLPHQSKMSELAFRSAGGSKGWNAHQGFYIYRGDRLLLAGDWLRFFKKEEHYKLARIQINLPNDMDDAWQIDIKKSVARPPLLLREQLRAYAQKVRNAAVEVYRHKGKQLKRKYQTQDFVPLWVEIKRGEKRFYTINRAHPMVMEVLYGDGGNRERVEILLRLIEESVPVAAISINESEQPEQQGMPFEGEDLTVLKSIMETVFHNYVAKGMSKEDAMQATLALEPFNLYPEILLSITDK